MIMLLMSPEEKHGMDREILKEPVLVYTEASTLSRLFKESYDSIIITRRYANLAGSKNVINAIKSLNLVLPIGGLDVTYLNHHSSEDKVSKELYKIGCKVLKKDIKKIDLEEFNNLSYIGQKEIKGISDQEVTDNLLSIISEIESMDKDSVKLYMGINYDKVTTSMLDMKSILEDIEGIREDNETLSNELQNALNSEKKIHRDMIKYNFLYNNVKSQYNKLLQYMTSYRESIDDYNSVLNNSVMSDEYIVKTNNTRTLVLYFKEIEDINFLRTYNSIINYLINILRLNVKSLILENTNRTYYNPYEGYSNINTISTTAEVVNEDRIVRYGNASSIIELLLRKQFMIQVLVIFDRTGNDSLTVDSDNQLVYYLGKKRENYPMLDIRDENFISPVEGRWTDIDILLTGADKLKQIPFDIHANRHPFVMNLIELVKDRVVIG